MNIKEIITASAFLLIAVLILKNYISIKRPYNYLVVSFIIPAVLIQTPLTNQITTNIESILAGIYLICSFVLLVSYNHSLSKEKK
ncbi:hypothetical protein CFB3_06790 [Clostridium folliculivorans]|uniref:Uncharacterized protein n=1 Tax=Clostridium folliculivorans TaxID=2886038 RepID=A0A9W5Y2X0_9CLOT|nr:hypothetical protein CFOLD11_23760 [Clostridium folliculivorans]GKU28573.1 hypothetical protein CFB3_06790 [Clostridium folliculivorans]